MHEKRCGMCSLLRSSGASSETLLASARSVAKANRSGSCEACQLYVYPLLGTIMRVMCGMKSDNRILFYTSV